ncbi:MAG TPA: hypothetical protein VEQ41_07150 [Solirubrobacterales bacterium]|nr:hypothetical protein [Solirubrobacterales bacterium]
MLGKPHRNQLPGGLRLGLLSVFALLAFACFPTLAVADECDGDSSQIEYCDVPESEIDRREPHSDNKSGSGKTRDDGQSATPPGSDGGDDGNRKTGEDEGAGPGGGKKDGDGKGGATKADKGKAGEGGLGSERLGLDPASDSSSPLVPILIALAVLAAISIGAVAMRRRRNDGDPGAPASPEAG